MHFVGTTIAYLRHASGMGCFVTPGWQHLQRYQPGANHNRVPPARCSFHSPTTRNKPLHGIGHCFKSRHRLLPQGQRTNHHIAMGDVVICLLIFCYPPALFRCESQAHAVVVVAASYIEVVTASYAAVGSAAAPATTTQHAVRPTGGTSRIGLWATAIAAIPIIAPLIYIATHVEKPKYIRCLTGYFMCA